MRWEDERYVRLYTRDTVDWLALSFEAQSLLALILRKLDRAGLLVLGKHGKRAVAVAIGHAARWEIIAPALEELLTDGCVRIEGDTLVMPNFLEAQEAAMSDRQRKAEQRARARDLAGAGRDIASRNVTKSPEPVTPSPDESQQVTPSRAVPCRAEPESCSLPAQAREAEPAPAAPSPRPSPSRVEADDVPPRRPMLLIDDTELEPEAAEVRGRIEAELGRRLILASPDRKAEVRARFEAAVDLLEADYVVAICLDAAKRLWATKGEQVQSLAYFIDALEEAWQARAAKPAESSAPPTMAEFAPPERWDTLIAAMTPAQRAEFEAEKQRIYDEVVGKNLWTSKESALLLEAEGFLFNKWSNRVAQARAAGGQA
jgi:hypothetical protein